MHRIKALIAAAAVAALAITAVGAPAAAATPQTKLAIVNGDAFRAVDVCVNGKEIRSGLPYGGKVLKTTPTASATVKFYQRSAKKCGGGLLAAKKVYLDDAVLVLTRKAPLRVTVFDARPAGPPANAGMLLGHAADFRTAEFVLDEHFVEWSPAADTEWTKGFAKWWDWQLDPAELWVDMIGVRDVNTLEPIGEPKAVYTKAGLRREFILVGTGKANAKIVNITRPY